MISAALRSPWTSPAVLVTVPSFSYAEAAGKTMSAGREVSVGKSSCTMSKFRFPRPNPSVPKFFKCLARLRVIDVGVARQPIRQHAHVGRAARVRVVAQRHVANLAL